MLVRSVGQNMCTYQFYNQAKKNLGGYTVGNEQSMTSKYRKYLFVRVLIELLF